MPLARRSRRGRRREIRDGALPVGEEPGLPLLRFPLHCTADAHRAVSGAAGKVLVDVTP